MGFRQAWKILLISIISCYIIQTYYCNASDTIQKSWKLLVGETLTSAGQVFEFGFFIPANSDKRYLGIWFKNIPPIKVVWVANRESPLKVSDSTVSLSISEYGNLVLLNGTQNVIWSSNVSVPTNNTVAVVLLDSGNLVLKDNVSGQSFWESFDYPCDTFLPGMKIGFNSITREKWLLSSWQRENDPSLGNFSIGISEQLSPQFFIWNKVTPYYRTGEWNGLKFIGLPYIDSAAYIIQFVFQQDYQEGTTYFTFLPNTSFLTFVELQSTGSVQVVQWTSGAPAWEIYATMVHAPCDIYNTCGPSAVCSKHNFPTCSCLRGFVPHSSDEWSKGNWTGGCVRQTELLCQQKGNSLSPGVGLQDGFFKLSGLKLPDLAAIFRLDSASECEKLCLNNCSCTAYAYVAGIRCMVWSGDLLDMQDYSYSGEDLFLRLAYSELVFSGKRKRKRELIICSAVFSCLFLGFALFCLLKHKIYTTGQKRKVARSFSLGDSCYISKDYTVESLWVGNLKKEDPIELPLIEFEVIVTATNNFKVENKLGEGGFGPVFKGKLKDGPEIAVKRLSNRTGQGIEEFKNEIVLISKLQHRNLVRLLGCCIEGEELLIIYEYMPNRSLDKSLFDASQKELLDWPKRFNIIQGVARGLLYLHRDSCLNIIHRDLKVSNILLDEEMNPKISDFGLARTFQKQQQLVHTHRVAGTYGYMSPEYALRGVFSEKSDVFSFGVLLLEIISGKKNSSFHYVEENLNLLNYAWKLWSEQRGLDFMDGTLINSFSPEEITRCLHVGLLCVQEHPRDRPTMADIILILNSEMKCSSPKQPTFKFETYLDLGGSAKDNERCSVNELSASLSQGRCFFSPSGANSDKWYIGIWYKEIQDRTIVWVANRAKPLSASSTSVLKITEIGNLLLVDGQTGNSVWSSEQTPATNVVAQLLDSGNFVIRPENDDREQSYLWQSFDYPTNTLLPGMKLGWDSKSGMNRNITSWKSAIDPAPGDYTFKINTSGFPEVYLTNKQQIIYRSGAWNGIRFSGVPEMKASEIISFEFQFKSDEITYMFKLHNKTLYSRLSVNHTGYLERFTWIPTSNMWNRFWYAPKDQCDGYTECGVSGICDTNISPICKCMVGFKPKNQVAWELRDGSNGCVRFHKLDCKTDRFNILRNMKLPDTTNSFVDTNMNLDECEAMCMKNCSCTAYTNSNISGSGSGCVIWSTELIDMRQYAAAEGGQVLYVRVASSDAATATENFSDATKLGQGGFGCVYKAMLVGQEVAVKRLSKNSGQGVEEFKNELRLIARLQHRNLVRLLGCCVDMEEKMLIYEYLENKSLDSILFNKQNSSLLNWQKRFNIICGIARGLLYLHQDSRFRIIHRDLKASNILLDKDLTPKISDFGMARIFGGDETEGNTKRVVGTYGYMSPEYAMDGLFSVKSDVFSFGVLVLEIVTGKKNRGFYYQNNQLNLLGHAWRLWKEGSGSELLDPSFGESFSPSEVMRCIQVGLLCVQEQAEDRPNMATVVLMLGSESASLPQPKNPGFCLGRRPVDSDSYSTNYEETCTVNQVTVTVIDPR
ncbi:G-type lectin S-receptor-like serine/threonine-protein kinase At1g61500 [Solanum stenotomum]|uniref:G-type lectin S-receptor-like serine/threonine-protein kinase At1g61500 n=1 Tax=Solanum stenotomum TaxID=172797 RepID=UPI0020CFFEE2|nr:G-type lectin S-receptor-like serine/threonine-protein kinase At1g61500 [Solanum stenotomum]